MRSDLLDNVGSLLSFDAGWIQILLAFLLIKTLGYCAYRAGSLFFLLDRMWIFFGGNKDFNDPKLNADWNVVRDLELFRYRYRLGVNSKNDIDSIYQWTDDNNVSLLELRGVASFFIIKESKLKEINYLWYKRILSTIIISLTLVCAILASVSIDKDNYFVVKKTDTSFKFNGDRIRIGSEEIHKDYCESYYPLYKPSEGNIAEFDKYVACELFSETGLKFYKKSILHKLFAGIILFSFMVCLLCFTCLYLDKCKKLEVLNKKIKIGKETVLAVANEKVRTIYQ